MLDVIVQVKQATLADWSKVERVLGFDWGVNTLLSAAIYQHNPTDPEHPIQMRALCLCTRVAWTGTRPALVARLISSKPRVTLASEDPKRILYEERSDDVGGSMRRATANWHTWPPICCCCSPACGAARSSVESASPRSNQPGAAVVSEGPLAQLEQQYDDPRRDLAHRALIEITKQSQSGVEDTGQALCIVCIVEN